MLSLARFLPNALKEHFKDVWNILDVFIFGLASVTFPMWLRIVVLHHFNFEENDRVILNHEDIHHDSGHFDVLYSQNLVNASQNFEVYKIGYILGYYKNLQGLLVALSIIKLLNYIEQYNSKIGMFFNVLKSAQQELIYFIVIFLLVIQCFIIVFRIGFGASYSQFSDNTISFISLLRFMLSDEKNLT